MGLARLSQLALALARGDTSSEALTEAALARATDPHGEGARTFIAVYGEEALAAARAADAGRIGPASSPLASPIAGLPISIKDLFDVEGEVTRAGSRVLDGAPVATRDATIVARLRRAGAILIGRTNMVEFAYSGLGLNPHFGTPRNPWDRASGRIPGGSSSGAAVSVTDGMCAAAIGTDTGGSVRIPSALCGLTGFKPTARRVDATGTLPLSVSLDSIGPLAASVECCISLDAVLAGAGLDIERARALKGVRLLLPRNILQDELDHEVKESFRRSAARLEAAGALIDEISLDEIDDWYERRDRPTGLAAAEAFRWHRELLARAHQGYDRRVAERIARGSEANDALFAALKRDREDWIRTMNARLAGYDALIAPTVACIAPPVAPLERDDALYWSSNNLVLRNTRLINYLDGCALSLPCHPEGGAPVGLMLAGPAGADARILSLGLAVEEALTEIR